MTPKIKAVFKGALSEAAISELAYALCPSCSSIFMDDIIHYGTLVCPSCRKCALQRGIPKEQAARMCSTIAVFLPESQPAVPEPAAEVRVPANPQAEPLEPF